MYDRFTDMARRIVEFAKQEAQRSQHERIDNEHFLLGLIKVSQMRISLVGTVLRNLGVDPQQIRVEVEEIVKQSRGKSNSGEPNFWFQKRKVIVHSSTEAGNYKDKYVGTEHILLGLLRDQQEVAAQALIRLGLTSERIRQELLSVRTGRPPSARDLNAGSDIPSPP